MPHQPANIDAIIVSLGRYLEGRIYGKSGGGWQLSAERILTGWGLPEPGTFDPLTITPKEYFSNASQVRTTVYQRVKNLRDCLSCVRAGIPLAASFEITRQWEKHEEVIRLDVPGDEYVGCHCLRIIGVDEESHELIGDDMLPLERGAARLRRKIPFEFFDRYLVEAYVCQYNTIPANVKYEDSQKNIQFRIYHSQIRFEGDAFGFHLYNKKIDDVFAWAMATFAQGVFHVEDFFVKPDYRRTGIGAHLLARVNEAACFLNAPLCFWVPWANHKEEDRLGFNALAKKLGWHFALSGVRWAAYQCGAHVKPGHDLTLPWIPERAGLVSPLPDEAVELLKGEWTEQKNEKRLSLIEKKYNVGLDSHDSTLLALLQSQLGDYQNKIAPLPFDTFTIEDPLDE